MSRVKFFVLFHNNLVDFAKELGNRLEVEFVVPKSLKVPNEINHSEIRKKTFSPFGSTIIWYPLSKLWNKVSKAEIIVSKHLMQPITLILGLMCKLQGKEFVVYQQKMKELALPARFLFKIIKGLFLPKSTKAYCSYKEDVPRMKYYFQEVAYLPVSIDSNKFKKRCFRKNKNLKVLCVAKLTQERKNHKTLLKAIEGFENVKLTMVGRKGKSNTYYESLNKDINSLDVKVNIRENIPYEEMKKLYSKHDLLVLPAKREPVGFVVLEAMSAGLPVICSDECGSKHYVKNGKNGYVFNADNPTELRKKIKSFLKDNEIGWDKIKKFGKESQNFIGEHNPKKNAEIFEKLVSS